MRFPRKADETVLPGYHLSNHLMSATQHQSTLISQPPRQTYFRHYPYHPQHTNMQFALLSRVMAMALLTASLAVAMPISIPQVHSDLQGKERLECKQ